MKIALKSAARTIRRAPASARATATPAPRMAPVQPRTMVEQAAEAIVGAAMRGVFLPGDRLVEAEIARDLNISRVPVREALRLLESQGIVANTPYKGMRLMELDAERVAELVSVRTALERLAAEEVLGRRDKDTDSLSGVRTAFARLKEAFKRTDRVEQISADIEFHTELIRAAGNRTLLGLWSSLSRQLAVLFGLSLGERPAATNLELHVGLMEALEKGDLKAFDKAFAAHVGWLTTEFDIAAVVEKRRKAARR